MLNSERAPEYWRNRAQREGIFATGSMNSTPEQNSKEYAERSAWLAARIDTSAPTLDYGCGPGWYTGMFTGEYLGVDMTPAFIEAARKLEPTRQFRHLSGPVPQADEVCGHWRQVFFATVLQHNSDETVTAIFRALADVCRVGRWCRYVIYEASGGSGDWTKGRSGQEYINLLAQVFEWVGQAKMETHIFHGGPHTLTIAGGEGRERSERTSPPPCSQFESKGD